ncbi:unnamed protein product [Rotaria sp. Silwood1]|nr:unnamed protein product [Rotaria sp. Silwood1]CAF1674287.1 unnamed protein product [Rotaria sp. Silwood1]
MALENTFSLSSAANHAMSFTDHAMQYFATQPENTNITFTHALPGFVRTTLGDNLPFWARLPLKCAKAIGLGVTSEQCAEFMIYGMLGTESGCRCVDDKGQTVTKKSPLQEEMVTKVWEHTSQIISPSK